MHAEPTMDVAHLGCVERMRFFADATGMAEGGRRGGGVSLRGRSARGRHIGTLLEAQGR